LVFWGKTAIKLMRFYRFLGSKRAGFSVFMPRKAKYRQNHQADKWRWCANCFGGRASFRWLGL
jgi:hypothetical protein